MTWIVEAVHRYRPHTTWGKDELNRYFSSKTGDRDYPEKIFLEGVIKATPCFLFM